MRKKIPQVLVYHRVDTNFHWGITRVTPKQFEKHLNYLWKAGYSTLLLKDLFHQWREGGTFNKKVVAITFDDSLQCLYRYAFPLLNKHDFKATLFVVSNFVGKKNLWDVNVGWLKSDHLSWDEISEMNMQGFEIGSHTASHPDLTQLSEHELFRELKGSKDSIEEKINTPVNFISFPFGRFNSRVVQIAEKCGYLGACVLCPQKEIVDPISFVIERKAVYRLDNIFTLRSKLGENRFSGLEKRKLRLINFFSWGTITVKNFQKSKMS